MLDQTEKGAKYFGQKIKLKWDDISTKMRHNMTAIVWNDKWNVHTQRQKCILHH